MTYRSDQLRHVCRHADGHLDCKLDREPDLSWLKGCLPRGIMPSDIDAMVEVNGHFLFIEYKGPGGTLRDGQRLALKRLSGQKNVTVMVIRERSHGDLFDHMIWHVDENDRKWREHTRNQVAESIREWARKAEEGS